METPIAWRYSSSVPWEDRYEEAIATVHVRFTIQGTASMGLTSATVLFS